MNNKIMTSVFALSVVMIGTIATTQAFAWHDWGEPTCGLHLQTDSNVTII